MKRARFSDGDRPCGPIPLEENIATLRALLPEESSPLLVGGGPNVVRTWFVERSEASPDAGSGAATSGSNDPVSWPTWVPRERLFLWHVVHLLGTTG